MSWRTSATSAFAIAIMLVASSTDSLAQDRSGVEQISTERPGNLVHVDLPQIAPPSVDTSAAQQLSPREQPLSATQLTGKGSAGVPVRQLYTGGRTAQPVEALSQPDEGRKKAGVVQRVAGADRCDAAAREHVSKRCAEVIETRAAEFEKPHPATLTPEQRLLISQQQREPAPNSRSLARRLGSPADPQTIEDQGIAATVTQPSAPSTIGAESKSEAVVDPAVQAIVNAIVTHVQR